VSLTLWDTVACRVFTLLLLLLMCVGMLVMDSSSSSQWSGIISISDLRGSLPVTQLSAADASLPVAWGGRPGEGSSAGGGEDGAKATAAAGGGGGGGRGGGGGGGSAWAGEGAEENTEKGNVHVPSSRVQPLERESESEREVGLCTLNQIDP
jgi:hypothetical protein